MIKSKESIFFLLKFKLSGTWVKHHHLHHLHPHHPQKAKEKQFESDKWDNKRICFLPFYNVYCFTFILVLFNHHLAFSHPSSFCCPQMSLSFNVYISSFSLFTIFRFSFYWVNEARRRFVLPTSKCSSLWSSSSMR